MKAMKQVVRGKDLPVSYLSNGRMYPVEGDEKRTQNIPFYRTPNGSCVIRWRLSWLDRIRMLIFGDLYQSVHIGNAELQPIRLDTRNPLTDESVRKLEWLGTLGPECVSRPQIIMSGRDMLNSVGLADVAALEIINGKYYIANEERIPYVLGEGIPERVGRRSFATENEALAALAKDIRKKNRGKWWER